MADEMTGTNHRWSAPDADGVRWCTKAGCTVRTARAHAVWQRAKGGHWRPTARRLIPECEGADATGPSVATDVNECDDPWSVRND